jgi:hypothetical protein
MGLGHVEPVNEDTVAGTNIADPERTVDLIDLAVE